MHFLKLLNKWKFTAVLIIVKVEAGLKNASMRKMPVFLSESHSS